MIFRLSIDTFAMFCKHAIFQDPITLDSELINPPPSSNTWEIGLGTKWESVGRIIRIPFYTDIKRISNFAKIATIH